MLYWIDLKLGAIWALAIAVAVAGILTLSWRTQQHPGPETARQTLSIAGDSRLPY